MVTPTMINKKEEKVNGIIELISGLEFSSHTRLGDYWHNTYYFRDNSEYHIFTENGTTRVEFRGRGLGARIFRYANWLKAHLMK